MSLHIYSRKWAGRTQIFTRTTTNATLIVNSWHHHFATGCLIRHHRDCPRRTVAGTVSAINTVCNWHAIFLYPNGMTNLCRRFLSLADFMDCSCRTHPRTTCTFRAAISAFITHCGLHQLHNVCRWPKHTVGTFRHAQLAGRAMLCHVFSAECPGRDERRNTFGRYLAFNHSQSTIHLLILLGQCGSRCCQCGSKQE